MLVVTSQQGTLLDIPTLVFAAAAVAGFLGILLILTWVQQREVKALAWWGAAYLIGASAIGLWGAPTPLFKIPPQWAEALFLASCGLVWSGVRQFRGRRPLPHMAFSGALLWLFVRQLPAVSDLNGGRFGLGAVIVAIYTVFIAIELTRERRKAHYSRAAAIMVPVFYSGVFLIPLALWIFMPAMIAHRWLAVLALESIFYGVGTAFIVLLMVKDHHVQFYRKAATTDSLTGLLNRGAFLDAACKLQTRQGARGLPVTLLMFDLDHFKSVNDRFGHAIGDSVLKVFAQVALSSVRSTDIVARLGGEEFVAMVPEPMEGAQLVAERLRAAYQAAGTTVDGIAVGSTVSIGLASSSKAARDIDSLLLRADAALYKAKHGGRNRFCCAEDAENAAPSTVPDPVAAEHALRPPVARRPKAGDLVPAE